jgi:hypothetical protein
MITYYLHRIRRVWHILRTDEGRAYWRTVTQRYYREALQEQEERNERCKA